ncbi:MAG: hypothetical protein WA885_15805 [Phormidesmis sp.]
MKTKIYLSLALLIIFGVLVQTFAREFNQFSAERLPDRQDRSVKALPVETSEAPSTSNSGSKSSEPDSTALAESTS